MIYPAISTLMKKVGSRYSLVIATAKRARELVDGDSPLIDSGSQKPVHVAVNEIYRGKIVVDGSGVQAEEEPTDFSEYLVIPEPAKESL